MKKPSFCAIALAAILGYWAFNEVRDKIKGNKMLFLERWMFSDRAYGKKIEVKPYLLNDAQVIQLLSHPEKEIEQPPQKDLYLKNVNVVLRIKNQGGIGAWGTLSYKLHNNWLKIDLKYIPPVDRKINKPVYDCVIPIGVAVPFDNDDLPDPIQIRWTHLYTKH